MGHAGRVLVVQALLGFICIGAFFVLNEASARSALLAVVSSLAPSAYYAWVQARTFNAMRLLAHGVMKSLFTVSLITICIVRLDIDPPGVFVPFAILQLSYLAPPTDGLR